MEIRKKKHVRKFDIRSHVTQELLEIRDLG